MSTTGTGMPPQQVGSYAAGTNSPYTSAAKMGEINAKNQMALIGGKHRKRRNKYRGGAVATNTLTVPPLQAGAVNGAETANQYKTLTALSAGSTAQAAYDTKAITKGGKRKSKKSRRSRRNRSSNRTIRRRRRR